MIMVTIMKGITPDFLLIANFIIFGIRIGMNAAKPLFLIEVHYTITVIIRFQQRLLRPGLTSAFVWMGMRTG